MEQCESGYIYSASVQRYEYDIDSYLEALGHNNLARLTAFLLKDVLRS